MEKEREASLGKALGVWMKRNNVRVADFRTKMGWSYQYAWRVARGHDNFSTSAIGTFVTVYGIDALRELYKIAGLKESPNGS